ncbi:uncharacterized protein TRIADDRAFT_18468 [Trichoplax adhaerens]|uniref:G-protein coupled receptors family 1 profile domain-containing protein n=1 Tax=Trichoplax adhaerens TaxID=10228 RepID=B3RIW1_TRIAD|nr:hypothetical protein TRIADDRAFT_18468 [Trichoplax adhaerens]EDV29261.1 hypothetical protein TRIADDRAFT_18468 [Trichoplax adhaerens]|eukprot:XP_002108463.1 hypothetical protein TRIADDRAFT_18468 [Trichoplax adhaerens]
MARNFTFEEIFVKPANVMVAKTIVSLIIFIGAFGGNAMVIGVLLRQSSKRIGIAEYYIAALAFADLLVTSLYVPINLLSDYLRGAWVFGAAGCKIINYIRTTAMTALAFTLVALAIDRYRAICRSFQFESSKARTKKTILLVWILSAALMTPYLYVIQSDEFKLYNFNVQFCRRKYGNEEFRTFMIIFNYLILCVVPSVILVFCYSRIILRIWKSIKYPVNEVRQGSSKIDNARKKTITTITIMTILFLLLWVPLWTMQIVFDSRPQTFTTEEKEVMFWVVCLANSCSVLHPIAYAFSGGKFQSKKSQTVTRMSTIR